MTALTDVDAVEAALGRALTSDESDRFDEVAAAASARFRRAAGGRVITAATTTAVLPVRDGRVQLAQRPVRSVDAVHALNGDGTEGSALSTWTFDGQATVRLGDPRLQQLNAPSTDAVTGSVSVTWTHGHDVVPEDVRHAVAAMTARVIASGAPTGVQSETIGGYGYRLGDAAAAGTQGMTSHELDVARAYRASRARTVGLVR